MKHNKEMRNSINQWKNSPITKKCSACNGTGIQQ